MIDQHSPIIDFYPTKFDLDMNGKKADWEAVVKIPFIESSRLLKAIRGTFFLSIVFDLMMYREK